MWQLFAAAFIGRCLFGESMQALFHGFNAAVSQLQQCFNGSDLAFSRKLHILFTGIGGKQTAVMSSPLFIEGFFSGFQQLSFFFWGAPATFFFFLSSTSFSVLLEAPYDPCFTVAPAFQKLVGAKVGGGWRRAVQDAVGGTKGCTHLKELLLPAATVAFQTMGSWPKAGKVATEAAPDTGKKKPYFIDGCKAWAADGPVVERLFPLHFRGRR